MTKNYDGKEIKLINTKEVTMYLTDIKYDEEEGPKLYFRLDAKNGENDYSADVIIRNTNYVTELFSFENVEFENNIGSMKLYNYYNRDIEALNLEVNKKSLERCGYTIQDYKNAFSNIKNFEIEAKLYKWVSTEEKNNSYNYEWDIQSVQGYRKELGNTYKIIRIKGNTNNLLKKLYKNITIVQKEEAAKLVPEEKWKKFDEIVPSDIIEKVDKITSEKLDLITDRVLQQFRNKKYAEFNGIPEYDGEKETYQMFDKEGNRILTITSCYIDKQIGSTTINRIELYYKITYQDKIVYYNVKE